MVYGVIFTHLVALNYTTEQAIRRLYYLGYTAEDEVIYPVLKRMEQCITGELDIDSYSEKKHGCFI